MTSRTYLHPVDLPLRRGGADAGRRRARPHRLAGPTSPSEAVERIVRTRRRRRTPAAACRTAAREPAFARLTAPRAVRPPALMGILNVTPDSFSREAPASRRRGRRGARAARWPRTVPTSSTSAASSTRPGAGQVPADGGAAPRPPGGASGWPPPGVTVSIDTRKAAVMAGGHRRRGHASSTMSAA